MPKRQRAKKKEKDLLSKWTVADAVALYGIDRWGEGVFAVNDRGHMCLRAQNGTPEIDLKELVDEIRLRGLELPVLIRFTDILQHRLRQIVTAFQDAIAEHEYRGEYLGVYPIKVNQHRHVLEDIMACGRQYHYGLEVGSKPELLIAITYHDNPEAPIICNGFKDRDYVETALESQRLGHKIFLVVEKPRELDLIIAAARSLQVDPLIGIRMKLSARGKGPWENSAGDRSKFGLFTNELVAAIKTLRRRRMLVHLQLLHFHLGSQVTDIQRIKNALAEATSVFVEVCRLGAPIRYVDVGGGLAVDYDGSHTNFASSSNYTLEEYAADVVNAFSVAASEAELPHPAIITEAGRALVAHHSLLVTEVLSASEPGAGLKAPPRKRQAPEILRRMEEILDRLSGKNIQEIYHDVLEARHEALMMFNLGHLSLEDRARVETFFWIICRQIRRYLRQLDYVPEELEGMEKLLSATYYCNFSVFQSVPDHWAVRQLFPVVPLHRLEEKPEVEAVLADITCDSDGVIDSFVDLRDVRDTLPLHPLHRHEPYYLGIFLVGAYQEILGDLHNLFGDTTVVHVSSGANGYIIDKTLRGDSVMDVLGYVQFTRDELMARVRAKVEKSLKSGAITLEQSAAFIRKIELGLDDYTYLDDGGSQRR